MASTLLMASAAIVNAEEKAAYSPADIVKFFADQEATRGICVGTEEECGGAAKKPAGFNLRLTFAKDSADLTDEARVNLESFAEALKSPSLSVAAFVIEGHTDASGTDAHNLGLSQRRAENVVSYLASLGVDKSKLEAVGLGEGTPMTADPLDPENRRVETRLVIQ
jgi:outer membrane protein OmpA-like peptidoglycan-associated protein